LPEPWYLFVGLIGSSIGFVMLMYGRKQHRPLQVLGGLVLLVLPYLLRDALPLGLSSAVICVAVWAGIRAGL
jgi:hypothetical protein